MNTKSIIFFTLLFCVITLPVNQLHAQRGTGVSSQTKLDINTDPFKNVGPLGGLEPEGERLLPKVVEVYLPSGSFLTRTGAPDLVKNAPNADAVTRIILFLYQLTKTEETGGETGKRLWQFSISLIVMGFLISGFMTFKKISEGEEPIGKGSINWLFRVLTTMVIVSVIAAKLPPTLIYLCDYITSDLTNWYTDADIIAKETAGEPERMIPKRILNSNIASGASIMEQMTDEAIIAYIKAKGMGPETSKQAKQIYDESKIYMLDFVSGASREKLENTITNVLSRGGNSDVVNSIIEKYTKDSVNAYGTVLEGIIQEVGNYGDNTDIAAGIARTANPSISGIARPETVVRNSAYIAFAMMGISIWALPMSCLVWCILFSMPKEWNFDSALISGIKLFIGVIITVLLITVYCTASLTTSVSASDSAITAREQQLADENSWEKWGRKNIWFIDKIDTFFHDTNQTLKAADRGVKALIETGNIGSVFLGISSTTIQGLILAMLIVTAPAQASLMLKGANGIAESAKQAMHAGGMSGSMHQGLGTGGGFGSLGGVMGGGGSGGGSGGGGGGSGFRSTFMPSPPSTGN